MSGQRLARLLKDGRADGPGVQPPFTRVLGPPAFGATRASLVVLVGVCLAIRALIEVQDTGAAHERLTMTRCLVLIVVLFLQGMMTYNEAGRCYRRKSEQSLVRLSPAAPVAGAINRMLGGYLLRRFAAMWGLSGLVTVAMLVALGATAGEALRAAAVCGLSLALAGTLLRDYSRGIVAHRLQPMTFGVVMTGLLVAAPAAVLGKLAGEAWAGLALAGMAAALLFVWRRWHCMLKSAPAFPAGRNP